MTGTLEENDPNVESQAQSSAPGHGWGHNLSFLKIDSHILTQPFVSGPLLPPPQSLT